MSQKQRRRVTYILFTFLDRTDQEWIRSSKRSRFCYLMYINLRIEQEKKEKSWRRGSAKKRIYLSTSKKKNRQEIHLKHGMNYILVSKKSVNHPSFQTKLFSCVASHCYNYDSPSSLDRHKLSWTCVSFYSKPSCIFYHFFLRFVAANFGNQNYNYHLICRHASLEIFWKESLHYLASSATRRTEVSCWTRDEPTRDIVGSSSDATAVIEMNECISRFKCNRDTFQTRSKFHTNKDNKRN